MRPGVTPIDEEGRLFGRINVVDAVAVLLAIAAVAGAMAVLQPSSAERETRYATLEVDGQAPHVARQISTGDVGTAAAENVAVTDVFVTPAPGGVRVYLRLSVEGRLESGGDGSNGQFRHDGRPLRPGTELSFATENYTVSGTVTNVTRRGETLPTAETAVRVHANVSQPTAQTIEAGDTVRVAGRTVGTVVDARSYPILEPRRRRVSLALQLRTIDRDGVDWFAGLPVVVGGTIPVDTAEYGVQGEIVRRGGTSPPGEAVETEALLAFEGLRPAVADEIDVGDVERSGGHTAARVTAVRSENATVILPSEDGTLHASRHPRDRDVHATVELSTRQIGDGLRFHGRPLRVGSRVTLDLGRITVTGRVVRLVETSPTASSTPADAAATATRSPTSPE